MRVALVHYWLVTWRGGESVLRAIADLFPEADIYTHVANKDLIESRFPGTRVRTTFVGRLPFATRAYQAYLPLMPMALEQLDLRDYDLIISSESGPAKGVIKRPDAVHVCYCHSPMRYAWDQFHDYRNSVGPLRRMMMGPVMHYMRLWDQMSAQRVDEFAANSAFVAKRLQAYYRRSSEVIHPPVDLRRFNVSSDTKKYFLWVGQLVPYKRPDLVVDAFGKLGYSLKIIGEGEMLRRLKVSARPNIEFLGWCNDDEIADTLAGARALVFPGVEDFGIVPLEAMASGVPVIAYARGGVLETVQSDRNGVFFHSQTAESLMNAVREFISREERFDAVAIRAAAEQFSPKRFSDEFRKFVARAIARN